MRLLFTLELEQATALNLTMRQDQQDTFLG